MKCNDLLRQLASPQEKGVLSIKLISSLLDKKKEVQNGFTNVQVNPLQICGEVIYMCQFLLAVRLHVYVGVDMLLVVL